MDKFNRNKTYKVVCQCLTFNQSDYIGLTLNGFFSQRTDFPYLCLVVDDCSTDGEQDTIKDIINRNCDIKNAHHEEDEYAYYIYVQHKTNTNCHIAVCLLKRNLFWKKEKTDIIRKLQTGCDYVAYCEGDDQWMDNMKLQKQVSYLDAHPQCGMVYTRSYVCDENNKIKYGYVIAHDMHNSYRELLQHNLVATLNVCARLSVVKEYYAKKATWPESLNWKMGDYPLWLYIAHEYDVYFMEDVTSLYRISSGSMSRPKDVNKRIAYLQSIFDIQSFFIHYFNEELDLLDTLELQKDRSVADAYWEFGDIKGAIKSQFNLRIPLLARIKLIITSLGVYIKHYNSK